MRRFPVGLTLAAAVGVAVLLGLGSWQLQRLAWKRALLGRIAALEHAAPVPAGPVLARAAAGADVGFARVSAVCAPAATPAPMVFRYALRDGRVGWRAIGWCPLEDAGPYDGIVLDRGLAGALAGAMAPRALVFPAPGAVVGVLRAPGRHGVLDTPPRTTGGVTVLQSLDGPALSGIARRSGGARPAPLYLAVERENPPPAGLTPAALPQDIPNNHFVYALTWFGLATVLVWMWAGYVLRRGP